MLKSDSSPAAAAIRQCEEKAKTLYHIDVTAAAQKCFVARNDVVKKLNDWNDSQVITLKTAGVLHVYRVLTKLPQTTTEIDSLAKQVFAQLQEREQKDLKRTDEMLGLITGSACFSRNLAEHFGDTITGGKKDCGHCTWCLTKRPVPLAKPPLKPFNMAPFNKILLEVSARDDARFLAKIAFGISSPRITAMKLGGTNPLFGSMDDHPFEVSMLTLFGAPDLTFYLGYTRTLYKRLLKGCARYSTNAFVGSVVFGGSKEGPNQKVFCQEGCCKEHVL
jgi:RecQ zinc-binding